MVSSSILAGAGRLGGTLLPSGLVLLAVSLGSAPVSGADVPEGKPVLDDPSVSDSGLDFFSQGGVVVDGIAYFTADQSYSKYWKGDRYPFVEAFDARTFRKIRTFPFHDTYDSCPIVIRKRDGTRLIVAHEYKLERSTAMDCETGERVWTSPANQAGAYFFGYSLYRREDGSVLLFVSCRTGLHALDGETGEQVWWIQRQTMGGVTPCVDQANGWLYYQADGIVMKVQTETGRVLDSTPVPHPEKSVSWNTVLVNDETGYFVATYWFSSVEPDGKTPKKEWNSAVRVYDEDLGLVWEKTGLPGAKKTTLTYARGKLVLGTGGHWGAKYTGDKWKRIEAYAIRDGAVAWTCDLRAHDFQAVINIPYAYGSFYGEAWGPKSKLFRIDADTGALTGVHEYGVSVNSCAPCLISNGRMLSGDLIRDGIVATTLAEGCTSDWPGPFGDPRTHTYALPDRPGIRPVAMEEVYVGIRRRQDAKTVSRLRNPPPPVTDPVRGIRVVATDDLGQSESRPGHVVDGNPDTYWHGSSKALTDFPVNLLLRFPRPATIDRLLITSQVLKNSLRLKSFEIYARAGSAWDGANPLAVVTDNTQEQVDCSFPPVTTDGIRLRIRDTWRPDHAYPRIREVEISRAPAESAGRRPQSAPVPGETEYERLQCEWALGMNREQPRTVFDPAKGFLHYAQRFVETMMTDGTDLYGDVRSPMFASILLLNTHRNPGHRLPRLEGQRDPDRAPFGGNLFHDVMLIEAMHLLGRITGRRDVPEAADAYLEWFLANCPSRQTGLFPWGEHAHWDFTSEAPGHNTHEYLGGIPFAFWERLWRLNPAAVKGEADGLINHIVDLNTFAWSRHAHITNPLPTPRPAGLNVADFPRHGGFYIALWTFVHAKTGDPKYLDWAMRAIDHHWRLKQAPLNLPPFTQDSRNVAVESAFSLAVSLLESAALLPAGNARTRYETVARTYLDAFAAMPHRPREGKFLTRCRLDATPSEATGGTHPWSAAYGGAFTADDGVLCCAVYRLTGREEFLTLARQAAEYYAAESPPRDRVVRAHVYGAVLTLFLDLYSQTHEAEFLTQARRYGRLAIERLYWNGLFRGATGIDFYESQLMVSNLVYGLVWLHALERDAGTAVPPNYFNR